MVEGKCSYVNRPSFRYASFSTGFYWEQTIKWGKTQRRNRNPQYTVNDSIGKCTAVHRMEHTLPPIIYIMYGQALLSQLKTMAIPTQTITILKSMVHMFHWSTGKKYCHGNDAIQITVLPEKLKSDWRKNMD